MTALETSLTNETVASSKAEVNMYDVIDFLLL